MTRTGELHRRLVHFAGTGYPALYLLDQSLAIGIVTWPRLQGLVVLSAVVALGLEAFRLTGHLDWAIYDTLTREYEQHHLAGYALYMIGMAVAVLAYDPHIAVPSVLMLTVADPVSGILSAGNLAKSLVVLLVTFGICLMLAAPFVSPAVAVAGAAVATVADGVKPVVATYVIDDNLTIPIGAGAAMTVAVTVV
ncbi:MAG: dolichol kinase [Halobacteriaceae archaeon]